MGRVLLQSAWQSATKITPFQVMYRRPPPSLLNYILGTANSVELDEELHTRVDILHVIREHLN